MKIATRKSVLYYWYFAQFFIFGNLHGSSGTNLGKWIPVQSKDGHWGLWSEWGNCSVTCGVGSWTRLRTCQQPQYRGLSICPGDGGPTEETSLCDIGLTCSSTTTAATSTGTATTASATITTTLNVGNDVWGQGDCPHNTQFDCSQALYGVVDQGSCIGLINRCDGIRDCTWSDLSFPSWDEDPTWCAILANNPGFF